MNEINSALTSAVALLTIARGALDARDDAKVRQALIDVQQRLFDASSASLEVASKAMELQASLSEARDEIRELKAQASEREAYALVEVRQGAYAYVKTELEGGLKPVPPFFCQSCYDKGVKSVLRLSPATEHNLGAWKCPQVPAHNIVMFGAPRY